MKNSEVLIRDPFVMLHEGKYYLYGTRSLTAWGAADGFDCYVSDDLENWDGPIELFRRPEGFFADREYWAPECVYHNGAFYLIATFGAEARKKGVYVLKSDVPTGPFEVYSDRLTPEDWTCIDGSVYFEDGIPWLFFSHSFEDTPDGDMCAMPLTADLRGAVGEPVLLFSAKGTPWAKPVPFAKTAFGLDGDVYLTDGPCAMKLGNGKLYVTWSSWSDNGYAVGVTVSESGRITGPWKHLTPPIFPSNGGHGMAFTDKEGKLRYLLHYPNDKFAEHPSFSTLVLDGDELRLDKE